MNTVRGQKVGTLQNKAFYILDNDRCRLGSKGNIQSLDEFRASLSESEQAELQQMLGKEMSSTPFELVYNDKPLVVIKKNTVTHDGKTFHVGHFYGTMSKGEARRVRKMLRHAGYQDMAGEKRITA